MAVASKEERIQAYERGFRAAGLPLFSEDFSPWRNVFNRAAPLLGLVFIGELLGAGQLDWSWWQNVLAIAGGLAIVMLGFGLINLAKGRPFSTVPQSVGIAELAGFVLIPALLPLIFGGQVGSAAVTMLANLALVGLIYAVGAYGLPSILRWVVIRFGSQLRSALGLVAKAVPLLAIFALLSFTNQEAWQIFSTVNREIYAVIVGLFVVLGAGFLLVRVPREAKRLEIEAQVKAPPLRRSQLVNVGLVMFTSQALQVLLVSLAVGIFFAVFGLLAINDSVRADWIGSPGNELFGFHLLGERSRGDRGAAARLGRAGRVLWLLLRDRDAHRLDLPPGVPRGADRGDAAQLPRPRRVPEAARRRSGRPGIIHPWRPPQNE